jgi:hypothetical protein
MKNDKNTDRCYKRKKVERLFLYCLGMSPKPLSISEIEHAVGKLNPGARQNFVYEVKKRLHHDSPYMPSRLLFKEKDFLRKEDKEFELEPGKFRNKVFEIYKKYFKCQSRNDLDFKYIEKENQYQEKIKGIMICDRHNNYLRIEINFTLLNEKGKLEKGMVKFFQKSRFSDWEDELNLYTGRENGGFVVRKFSMVPNYFFLDLIDEVFYQDGEKKFVLNLRGLLYLFLLYEKKLKVSEIEKIISNISNMDEYMYLRNEIDSAYGSIVNIKFLDGKPHDVEKIFGSTTSHQIKTRFPFLSFYEAYKDYIRSENKNFVSDFLFYVAQDLERQLRNMSITRLKYEVTKMYLQRIRRYFYDIHTQRLVHVDLSDETFNAITRLQDEIGIYIEEMKKSEYEREKFERQSYEKDQARMRFQRRLNTLTDLDKNVISLKDILPDNGIGGIIIDAPQISIIERFCKYGREENESYSFTNYYILIKNTLLKEIAQKINQNNYNDDLRSELDRNAIPLDCKKDVENWINNYYESI